MILLKKYKINKDSQTKHIFSSWYPTTFKYEKCNKSVVLLDCIDKIVNKNFIIENTISEKQFIDKLHISIKKLCTSVYNNILLNVLFANNEPIQQFIINIGSNNKNNTTSFCISDGSFVGLSFNSNSLIATSCLKIEFNNNKSYHCYPYIRELPTDYRESITDKFDYYKIDISDRNYSELKNEKVNGTSLISIMIKNAINYHNSIIRRQNK